MTFQPGAMVNTQAFANSPISVAFPHLDIVDPTSANVQGDQGYFPIGKRWVNTVGQRTFELVAYSTSQNITTAVWASVANVAGPIDTITTQDLTVISPSSNNINLSGSGSLTTTGAGATATVSLTGLTNHAVLVGAGTDTITKLAVGATGTILAGNTGADPAFTATPSGLTSLSAGTLTATTTVAAGTTVTGGTGVTATTGNVTATNGNIVRGTAGNKDIYTSVATTIAAGANSAGTVTLVAGEAVVSTTSVTASSQIRIYRQGVGATGAAALGVLSILTRTPNVSFTIRAVQPADATAAQVADVSVIGWEIVN